MPTGLVWKQHFKKQSTLYLTRLYNALTIILRDPMMKKEYGEEEGMDTLKFFIEMELMERKRK